MRNDTTAINDLVTKTAEEKAKEKENTGDQSQSSQQGDKSKEGGNGGEQSQEQKDAVLKLEQENAAKALEEKGKQEAADKDKENALMAKLLGDLGVKDIDELKEKVSQSDKKPLSKEEQDKEDEIYEAKLRTFAVEKGLSKLDDFDQLKTLKSKQDAELIFEGYLKDWKEENADVTENIEEEARKDFETEYKLNSTNDKIKAKGVARLAKEAGEIRNPYESSYKTAKDKFDTENELRDLFPKFQKSNETIAAGLVPEKIEWFKGKGGENDEGDEVPIEVPLSKEDRTEILDKINKRLETPANMLLFKQGKVDEIKESVSEYADYLISKKAKGYGDSKIAEIFLGRGMEKGSKVGAENSFATNQAKTGQEVKDKKTSKADAEQEVLNQPAFKK